MDIEHLTKHQIILLTLLVSFVTSIATGIVTVSLMDQAPPSVTRTINQIVEHTVERVVPSAAPVSQGAATAAAVTTKETTIVVKDEDLVAGSIDKVQKSIIRIVSLNAPDQLVARGIIISDKGVALSDRGSLEPMGTVNFEAILPNGQRVPAVMRVPVGTSTIAVLDLSIASSTDQFIAAALADRSKLRLGQSVIRIGGTGADTIGVGVIATLPGAGSNLIQATVVSSTPGSVILTAFGEIIGLMTSDSAEHGADYYTTTSP